jgi:hypothetical protein
VIFKSEGADDLGVFSMAVSKPFPKDAIGSIAAARAPFVKNERLDVLLVVDFIV